jgi:hypothetical protein
LASTLEELRDDHAVAHDAPNATAQSSRSRRTRTRTSPGSRFNNRFDTHTPLEDRVKPLQEM